MLAGADGADSARDHLMQVCRQTSKTPAELGIDLPEPPEPPEPPEGGDLLWGVFMELSGARGSNGFGPNPLSWQALDAYARLSGVGLTPYEAETIRAMDLAFMAAWSEARKKEKAHERPEC